MAERCVRTGKFGFSGAELRAVADALAIRDAQLESEDNTCGLEIAAALRVDQRIAEGNVVRVVDFRESEAMTA